MLNYIHIYYNNNMGINVNYIYPVIINFTVTVYTLMKKGDY